MAGKTLSQIKAAEGKAQALIKNAQEEAAQIIKRAEEETAAAFEEFSETCKQQAAEKKRQTALTADTVSTDFSKETAVLCAALKEKLNAQKSKAVDAVIQTVMV